MNVTTLLACCIGLSLILFLIAAILFMADYGYAEDDDYGES